MKSNGKRRPIAAEDRKGMTMIVLVVCILLIVLAYQCRKLADRNDAYAQQIETLQQQITEESGRGENIDKYRNYTHTDAYVEKIAREKLGLVYPDEVIFQPSN